jgi:hypothetical protein
MTSGITKLSSICFGVLVLDFARGAMTPKNAWHCDAAPRQKNIAVMRLFLLFMMRQLSVRVSSLFFLCPGVPIQPMLLKLAFFQLPSELSWNAGTIL